MDSIYYCWNDEVVWREIESEIFIQRGKSIFHLNSTASTLWKLLDGTNDSKSLIDHFLYVYDAKIQDMKDNIVQLLNEFKNKNLISLSKTIVDNVNKNRGRLTPFLRQRLLDYGREQIIPVSNFIEITNKCNMKCIHCCQVEKNTSIPQDILLDIVKGIRDMGGQIIIVSGGEILLYKNVLEVISFLDSLGYDIILYTNGTLWEEDLIRELEKFNIYEIHISLYSPSEESHNYVTCDSNSYKKSLTTIKLLKKHNFKVVIKMPLIRPIFGSIKNNRTIDFAKELGVELIMTPMITARDNGDISTYKYRLCEHDLIYYYTYINPIGKIEEESNKIDAIIPCNAGRTGCEIDAFGNVYACSTLRKIVGNIYNCSFKDIWFKSDELRRIRELQESEMEYCKSCIYKTFCIRCPGLSLNDSGDYSCPSNFDCLMAKARYVSRKEVRGQNESCKKQKCPEEKEVCQGQNNH